MKKKIVLLVALVATIALCTGCIEWSKREYVSGKNNNTRWVVDKFNYNGHQYLEFSDLGLDGGGQGFVHDPDCPCHNKE